MITEAANFTDVLGWFPGLPQKDSRIEGWLLLHNPFPIMTILAGYVYFVKVFGPHMMRDTRAYELRSFILFYNAAMIVANLTVSSLVIYHYFWSGHGNLWLTAPDRSNHPTTLYLLNISWYYLLLRLAECIETIVFVLRKRFRQISFLHVFHHVSVTLSAYIYVTYGGFLLASFELVFNALVHVVMYFYYFLSACGPAVQQYLWWKKYLTTVQIVQFVIMIVRNIHLAIWLKNEYSWLPGFMLFQCFVFFLQFSHFYVLSYKRSRGEKSARDIGTVTEANNNGESFKKHI